MILRSRFQSIFDRPPRVVRRAFCELVDDAAFGFMAGGAVGFLVQQSQLHDRSSSEYMHWTPSGAGNTQHSTISVWVKRTDLSGTEEHIAGASGGGTDRISFEPSNRLRVRIQNNGGTTIAERITTQKFRDVGAWFHLAITFDLSVTTDNCIRIWKDGVEITAFDTKTNLSSATTLANWNTTDQHQIGAVSGGEFFGGLLTEFVHLDGATVTDASSFGEIDANGNWVPVDVSGLTFGTNGWYLDGSGVTDQSGNGNNFTNSGVEFGLLDSSTDDAASGVGNHCVMSNIDKLATVTNADLDNGGLGVRCYADGGVKGTIYIDPTDADGFYFEVTPRSAANASSGFGLATLAATTNSSVLAGGKYLYMGNGDDVVDTSRAAYGASYTTETLGCLIKSGTLTFYKGGVSQGTSTTGLTSLLTPFMFEGTGSPGPYFDFNFGQRSFTYTPPTGSKTICTANLPAPAAPASVTPITGSFTGNANADGPVVWLGYTPDTAGTCTINSNAITWGTDAIPLAGGFKVITSSTLYNSTGSNTYSIAVDTAFGGAGVSQARAQAA